MSADLKAEEAFAAHACAACGHDPACGMASTWDAERGERWLCHAADHSCYEADKEVAR